MVSRGFGAVRLPAPAPKPCKIHPSHGCADSLKMGDVEILLNFGNCFRTLQLGFRFFFRNYVSSLLSMHYSASLFTSLFDIAKA